MYFTYRCTPEGLGEEGGGEFRNQNVADKSGAQNEFWISPEQTSGAGSERQRLEEAPGAPAQSARYLLGGVC